MNRLILHLLMSLVFTGFVGLFVLFTTTSMSFALTVTGVTGFVAGLTASRFAEGR